MIGWMIRASVSLLALAALAYVVVFVPIGHFTLYRHAARIAATPEARTLAEDVRATAAEAGVTLREAVATGVARPGGR